MESAFVDELGFRPLEPALHDVLLGIGWDEEWDFHVDGFDDVEAYKELELLGYLNHVTADLSGNVCGSATAKGRRYASDYADWQRRRDGWEALRREERERERAEDRRHDWRLNVVNGVYALVAAALGAAIGYWLGAARPFL